MRRLSLMLLLVSSLGLAACEDQGDELAETVQPDQVTLVGLQSTVFDVSCAISGCHASASAPGNLNLSAGVFHGNTVGQPSQYFGTLIIPGDPDNSILLQRMEGALTGFDTMPQSGALPQETLNRVRQWIQEGALDN